jgi:outer membrane protein insertion porin family
VLCLVGPPAAGQDQVTDGMTVKRVELEGLQTISEGYVRRIIKTRADQPFAGRQVLEDTRELLRTRKFLNVFATTRVEEGQVVVVFTLQEKPEIISVELEGNKRFKDEELFKLTPVSGQPIDRYEINRAREDIERKYKEAGYYYSEVELDERALAQEGRVIYRITEGPRVKVRKVRLEGARSFPELRLRSKIETKTYLWIFRKGAFDEDQAERDALALQAFYREEGFLDARVGYRLEFDTVDRSNLAVVFVFEEGDRYRIQDVRFSGNEVFSDTQMRGVMQLGPGSVLRQEALRQDLGRIRNLYGEIGYVDAEIGPRPEFVEEPGVVLLNLDVLEGKRSRFGRITVRGNQHTKDEVARRELRFYPGQDYNTIKARKAEQRLEETGLFTRATITPLEDVDGFREALVEVEEAETILFLIGVGISTDSGVLGSLSIENRNFDLFDWPRTWGEFFRGEAFRGDGQRLNFRAEPGTELTRFRISFTEPYLLDRPLRLDTSAYLFQRGRDAYLEERLGFVISLSRRFEGGSLDGWAVEGAARVEGVDISDLDPFPAKDIRDARGTHLLTALKGSIVRDTTDSRLVPSEGYRLSFSWEQVGALGGDHDFGKPAASFAAYKTMRTDVYDRKSVLAVRADAAYVVGDAPVFERFYGGGFGSIRGFDFRGVSPRAGVFSNRVGGDFILLTGAEYSFPLYAETLRGVAFLDMGTVEEDFGITSWRASVGFGFRVTINFFGPVPFVFDFGWPIARDDDDDTRVFNFSMGASF